MLNGDTAKASCYLQANHFQEGLPSGDVFQVWAKYRDDFVRTPNGWKITIMLEECGLPYAVKPVNLGKGDQFKPEFLKISPNNRMPAIVDHDATISGMSPVTRNVTEPPTLNDVTEISCAPFTIWCGGCWVTPPGSVRVPVVVSYLYVPIVIRSRLPVGVGIVHGSKCRGCGVHAWQSSETVASAAASGTDDDPTQNPDVPHTVPACFVQSAFVVHVPHVPAALLQELPVARQRADVGLPVHHEELPEQRLPLLLAEVAGRAGGQVQEAVSRHAAHVIVELLEEHRREVDGAAHARVPLQHRRHVVVGPGGVEPDPGQEVLAGLRVPVERLVHVPQEGESDLGAHPGNPSTGTLPAARPGVKRRRAGDGAPPRWPGLT